MRSGAPPTGSPYWGHWAVGDTGRDPLAEANIKRLSIYQESPTGPITYGHKLSAASHGEGALSPPLKPGLASGPAETNSSAQPTPTQRNEPVLGGGSSGYCAVRTLGTD